VHFPDMWTLQLHQSFVNLTVCCLQLSSLASFSQFCFCLCWFLLLSLHWPQFEIWITLLKRHAERMHRTVSSVWENDVSRVLVQN